MKISKLQITMKKSITIVININFTLQYLMEVLIGC